MVRLIMLYLPLSVLIASVQLQTVLPVSENSATRPAYLGLDNTPDSLTFLLVPTERLFDNLGQTNSPIIISENMAISRRTP